MLLKKVEVNNTLIAGKVSTTVLVEDGGANMATVLGDLRSEMVRGTGQRTYRNGLNRRRLLPRLPATDTATATAATCLPLLKSPEVPLVSVQTTFHKTKDRKTQALDDGGMCSERCDEQQSGCLFTSHLNTFSFVCDVC